MTIDLLQALFAVVAFVLVPFVAIALLFGVCVLVEALCQLLRSGMHRQSRRQTHGNGPRFSLKRILVQSRETPRRFVRIETMSEAPRPYISIVQHWFAEFRERERD